VPVAKVLRAWADVTTILSREPAVFSMVHNFADALGLPLQLSYGLYSQFSEGGLEPNAVIEI
jgi:hypothetical protein